MGSVHLFEFMPDDGTGDAALAGGAGAGAATDAAGDVGAAAPEAAAAGAEPGSTSDTTDGVQAAAPTFDPREVEAELEYLREQNQQLLAQWQQQQTAATTGEPEPGVTLDPFDDSFGTSLQQLIRQELQQAVQPLAGRFEQQEAAAIHQEGEQRIIDAISDDVARNGEFVPGDKPEHMEADRQARMVVRTLAEQMFPTYAERYGPGQRAGAFAIEKAAAQVRELLKAYGDSAISRHTNQVATLAGARSEPAGTGGTGTMAAVGGQPFRVESPTELARRFGNAG